MKDRSNTGGSSSNPAVMMAMPSYIRMNNPFTSLNQTKYERLFLQLKDPNDKDAIEKLILNFKSHFTPAQSNNV